MGYYTEAIKQRVSSREVFEAAGIHVGRNGFTKCPFHGDQDASLKVYSDPARGWHCFGCHRGGDVLSLAMLLYNTDFKGAEKKLNEDFMLGLPIGERLTTEQKREMRAANDRREAERSDFQARAEAAEKAYWDAYDAWLENERIIAEQAPRSPSEPFTEAFVRAITHKAEIRDTLDIAEERRRQCLAK